jgi:hypothetical protein
MEQISAPTHLGGYGFQVAAVRETALNGFGIAH